jgi:uncharacterized membrane protein YdjX (TVP38/TMEM64 family)
MAILSLSSRKPLIKAVLVISVVIVIAMLFGRWVDDQGGPQALQEALGDGAVPIILAVHILSTATPMPTEVFVLGYTSIYGFKKGVFLAWVGGFFGSLFEFYVAKYVAKGFNFKKAIQSLPLWLQKLRVQSPGFLIVARWFPLGTHLVNCLGGVYGISVWRHSICAAVSILPQALVWSALGNGVLALF